MSSNATVKLLRLAIPGRGPTPNAARDLQPAALHEWLQALPLANAPEAARQILERLQRGNRVGIEPQQRYQAAEALRAPVEALVETLNTRYQSAALPLSTRNRAQAATVRGLLEELSHAYKIVIVELLGAPARTEQDQQTLLNALPRTVACLGRLVQEQYLVHAPEQGGVWGELQRLYLYAEQMLDPAQLAEFDGRRDSAQSLVAHAYLRIALLALANPYHLMPGEVASVYAELARWSESCHLLQPQPGTSLAGKFVVDLGRDAPPSYMSSATRDTPEEPRIIDLHTLLAVVDEQIKDITLRERVRTHAAHLGLAARMRRDMLQRLKHAWGGRADRKVPRADRQSRVYLSVGLSACHHFIAGEVPFMPERDEVRVHRGETLSSSPLSTLTLVPKEHEHWKMEEQSERLARGISQPRVSRFDTDSPELDIWRKIHSTTEQSTQDTEGFEPLYVTKVLRQKNQGAGGLCLSCAAECQVQTRVGELLAYKSEADPEQEWRIGMIRWLRCLANEALELGVMRLADEAIAVATRAVQGLGKGGEYFRALLASSGTPARESLIVPAAIYDIDTVLVINLGTELNYVRLTQLLETTSSFSQFGFERTETPDSEQEKIESIRNMRV